MEHYQNSAAGVGTQALPYLSCSLSGHSGLGAGANQELRRIEDFNSCLPEPLPSLWLTHCSRQAGGGRSERRRTPKRSYAFSESFPTVPSSFFPVLKVGVPSTLPGSGDTGEQGLEAPRLVGGIRRRQPGATWTVPLS